MKRLQNSATRISLAAFAFVCIIGLSLISSPSGYAAPSWQGGCDVALYEGDIDCADPPPGGEVLGPSGLFLRELDLPEGQSDSAAYSICGSVDISGMATVSTTLNSGGWGSSASFVYGGFETRCETNWWNPPCQDENEYYFDGNPLWKASFLLQVNGGYSAAQVYFADCEQEATPTPTPTQTNTPTPTGTPAPTSTPTPSPTPWIFVSYGYYDPYYSNLDCGDPVAYAAPFASALSSTLGYIQSLDTAITNTIPVSVVLTNNPISYATGFVYVMADVTWLQLLFGWFALAFGSIIFIFVVRFIISMWGIIERIIALIKLIPFV
jgi:hypothetical protein